MTIACVNGSVYGWGTGMVSILCNAGSPDNDLTPPESIIPLYTTNSCDDYCISISTSATQITIATSWLFSFPFLPSFIFSIFFSVSFVSWKYLNSFLSNHNYSPPFPLPPSHLLLTHSIIQAPTT